MQPVAYHDGGTLLTGLHAAPSIPPRAVVTNFPTFINSTPSVETKAAHLVEAGFAVIIADFYGSDEAPSTPEQAFGAMTRLRSDAVAIRQRLRCALCAGIYTDFGTQHAAIGHRFLPRRDGCS